MRLRKDLGQHILLSKGVLSRIAEFLCISEGDKVLEIGGGTGNLTRVLLERPLEKIYVLEIDPVMVETLKRIEDERITVIQADATRFDLCSLGDNLKVTGNLPYNVASLIIENLVRYRSCIPLAVLMVQKEVGLKIVGKSQPGWITLFVNTFYDTEYLMSVPSRFFLPRPKVVSGVIRLRRKDKAPDLNLDRFKRFLTRLFSSKKKKIGNLFPKKALLEAGLDPNMRSHQLTQDQVLRLYNVLER